MDVPRPPYPEIGRLINEARIRKHLSIRAAARIAGVPPATLQGWLNGRHLPTPALRGNFEMLLHALDLTCAQLVDWTAPPEGRSLVGQTPRDPELWRFAVDEATLSGLDAAVG